MVQPNVEGLEPFHAFPSSKKLLNFFARNPDIFDARIEVGEYFLAMLSSLILSMKGYVQEDVLPCAKMLPNLKLNPLVMPENNCVSLDFTG